MEKDLTYIQKYSTVLIDAAMRTREVHPVVQCKECNNKYSFIDSATEFIPYEVEYLSGHLTDEDIAREEKLREYANS